MKHKIRWALLLLIVPMCAGAQRHDDELHRQIDIFVNLYRTLDMFYVDSLQAETAVRWAIDGMLSRVDPYTVYYPRDNDDELTQMTTGAYGGIGSVIRYHQGHHRAQISEPYEGAPSARAGLKAGDVILTIDGRDVYDQPTTTVTQQLRGEAGTTFVLQVLRNNTDTLTMSITRRNIQRPSIPYNGIVEDGVGYLLLDGFTEGSAVEVRRSVQAMLDNGMSSLVFDLRDNPGGSLDEAADILSLFVPKGSLVVSTRGKLPSTCREWRTRTHPIVPDSLPIVVLVNSGSASAAEIVSGALQDMDRAVIVGGRTYGKGLVQSIREMPSGGSLKLTTSRYHIPSGRCIQAYDYRHLNADGSVGVVPDSLTNVFHTANGREVRDGGGITPDVVLALDTLPTIVYDLFESDAVFDYVTWYNATHEQIDQPGYFCISDADYQEFVDFVVARNVKYNRRSSDMLRALRQMATIEGYGEVAREEFDALEAKLNADAATDLQYHREVITRFLNAEIVTRYYHQYGFTRQMLVGDKTFDKALTIIRDGQYRTILQQ